MQDVALDTGVVSGSEICIPPGREHALTRADLIAGMAAEPRCLWLWSSLADIAF